MTTNDMNTAFFTRLYSPPTGPDWTLAPWTAVTPYVLRHHLGVRPNHFPHTEVKLGYDDTALFLVFRVEDRYVRAVARNHQDPVCRDSCVEFFFAPTPGPGYFNLEINCGGTMLFAYHPDGTRERAESSPADCTAIVVHASLPQRIEPERTAPLTWTICCSLPFEVLMRHTEIIRPAPGIVWRGNFYKCADTTSHPHWLSWAPVIAPTPDFHQPHFFGCLRFC